MPAGLRNHDNRNAAVSGRSGDKKVAHKAAKAWFEPSLLVFCDAANVGFWGHTKKVGKPAMVLLIHKLKACYPPRLSHALAALETQLGPPTL